MKRQYSRWLAGVGVMFGLSAIGGIGGNSGRCSRLAGCYLRVHRMNERADITVAVCERLQLAGSSGWPGI